VAGALVRLQGDKEAVPSDRRGRFRLSVPGHVPRAITAWKQGYRIAAAQPDTHPLQLHLVPLPRVDHEDYTWIDPAPDPLKPTQCGNCHAAIYTEWMASAHARSATNPRFLSLFGGPERPSSWNLLREYPLGSGVCATCHVPTLRDPSLDYDVRRSQGVDVRGIHCDFCHKVTDAPTDNVGLSLGRDGLTLLRPARNDLLTFGPLVDAVRPGESFGFAPVYKESRYCASCHEGVVFGVHVYGSYSEWLQSPARAQGKQCQDCHMAPTGKLDNIAPGKGGITRDPSTLASHHLPGGQAEPLRRCLQVRVRMVKGEKTKTVEVDVLAKDVGHRVPTGFIDRNLVLVVEAKDAAGRRVPLLQGATLPPHAGASVEGLPGRLFAKQHLLAGKGPVPFWVPADSLLDTRLYPERPERLVFVFSSRLARVSVRLLYRNVWPHVAADRGWWDNEKVLFETTAS